MKKKKITLLVLSSAFMLGGLSACGGKKKTSSQVSVNSSETVSSDTRITTSETTSRTSVTSAVTTIVDTTGSVISSSSQSTSSPVSSSSMASVSSSESVSSSSSSSSSPVSSSSSSATSVSSASSQSTSSATSHNSTTSYSSASSSSSSESSSSSVSSSSSSSSQTSSESSISSLTSHSSSSSSSSEDTLVQVETIRVHYRREDNSYSSWALYSWMSAPSSSSGSQLSFSGTDSYGAYVDIDVTSSMSGISQLGMIIKPGDSWNGQSANMYADIPQKNTVSTYNVYIYDGIKTVFYSEDDALKNNIQYSKFTSSTTLETKVILDKATSSVSASMFHLYEDGVEVHNYSFSYSSLKVTATFAEGVISASHSYTVQIDFSSPLTTTCDISVFYDTADFYNNYTYYGNDLGVSFNESRTRTTFKLWAPVSSKVVLNLYSSGSTTYQEAKGSNYPYAKYELKKEQQGVWSVTLDANLHGKYYTFSVTNGNETNEIVDPYAKSCGINGQRGMVVDFDKINDEIGWSSVSRPDDLTSETDQSIYEIHVKDMTIDSTSGVKDETFDGVDYTADQIRGKFLGLSQEGTTYNGVTTGLDHIKELGVNTVQIMPMYDYSSVDETTGGYNWGYDPLNYNCLEGSYSLNPYDGEERIKEFKETMKAFCSNNIHVTMDVVFNHTAQSDDSKFEKIIPGYYHRMNSDGSFSNGSGCGNEVASERPMTRKYIVDSCKFWMKEYNLSGFRFDLMGLLDAETMREVASECEEIYPEASVYGEPWTGGSTTGTYTQTLQSNIGAIPGVGAFNDKFRNGVRGENNSGATGWLMDGSTDVSKVCNGIYGTYEGGNVNPYQVVNYVSCHDNYTLYDQINVSSNNSNIAMKTTQANSLVYLSEGVPFMQEGDDFMRTKDDGICQEIHNTYNYGPSNVMHWDLKVKNISTFNINKSLVALRKAHSGLRLSTYGQVQKALSFTSTSSIIAYTVSYGGEELLVVHSATGGSYSLSGTYNVLYSNNEEALIGVSCSDCSYGLKANETVVFKKGA